uniref:C3H1-type domain-containing protein n=1 Tax=Eutreptiella gymnastica TaxID=73025 RepID=A0A7S1NDK5_9EUGL|mmetsp:Transcript_19676/g.34969  ORF Transcript_19676/g.34969 Transcript_19676/m.34969 type:complete len:638 (+) Transcript_19676:28-1941(+)
MTSTVVPAAAPDNCKNKSRQLLNRQRPQKKNTRRKGGRVCAISTCCRAHGTLDSPSGAAVFDELELRFKGLEPVPVPSSNIALTEFWNHSAVPQDGEVFSFSPDSVCDAHQRNTCLHGASCTKIHICREFWSSVIRPFNPTKKKHIPATERRKPEGQDTVGETATEVSPPEKDRSTVPASMMGLLPTPFVSPEGKAAPGGRTREGFPTPEVVHQVQNSGAAPTQNWTPTLQQPNLEVQVPNVPAMPGPLGCPSHVPNMMDMHQALQFQNSLQGSHSFTGMSLPTSQIPFPGAMHCEQQANMQPVMQPNQPGPAGMHFFPGSPLPNFGSPVIQPQLPPVFSTVPNMQDPQVQQLLAQIGLQHLLDQTMLASANLWPLLNPSTMGALCAPPTAPWSPQPLSQSQVLQPAEARSLSRQQLTGYNLPLEPCAQDGQINIPDLRAQCSQVHTLDQNSSPQPSANMSHAPMPMAGVLPHPNDVSPHRKLAQDVNHTPASRKSPAYTDLSASSPVSNPHSNLCQFTTPQQQLIPPLDDTELQWATSVLSSDSNVSPLSSLGPSEGDSDDEPQGARVLEHIWSLTADDEERLEAVARTDKDAVWSTKAKASRGKFKGLSGSGLLGVQICQDPEGCGFAAGRGRKP